MTVIFSALSAYQSHSLQDLIGFLAIVSTAIWVGVALATAASFGVRATYKHKTKRLEKEQS